MFWICQTYTLQYTVVSGDIKHQDDVVKFENSLSCFVLFFAIFVIYNNTWYNENVGI